MNQISSCSISFDKLFSTYYGGDTLSGCVLLEVKDDISCGEIYAEARGITEVRTTAASTLSKTDRFFKSPKLLFNDVLPRGSHVYSFQFILPRDIASSYDGTYGRIKYEVVVVIKSSSASSDLASKTFTFVAGLDLSYLPEAVAKIEVFKTMGFGWCFADETLCARWRVEGSGYVPNDVIKIKSWMKNYSKESAFLKDTILNQVVSYKPCSGKKRFIEKIEVARATCDSNFTNNECMERLESLTVPPNIPVTSFANTPMLSISYELQFGLEIEGNVKKNFEESKEIYIGSVALDMDVLIAYAKSTFNHKSRVIKSERPRLEPSAPPLPDPFCPLHLSSPSSQTSPPPPYSDIRSPPPYETIDFGNGVDRQ